MGVEQGEDTRWNEMTVRAERGEGLRRTRLRTRVCAEHGEGAMVGAARNPARIIALSPRNRLLAAAPGHTAIRPQIAP